MLETNPSELDTPAETPAEPETPTPTDDGPEENNSSSGPSEGDGA